MFFRRPGNPAYDHSPIPILVPDQIPTPGLIPLLVTIASITPIPIPIPATVPSFGSYVIFHRLINPAIIQSFVPSLVPYSVPTPVLISVLVTMTAHTCITDRIPLTVPSFCSCVFIHRSGNLANVHSHAHILVPDQVATPVLIVVPVINASLTPIPTTM